MADDTQILNHGYGYMHVKVSEELLQLFRRLRWSQHWGWGERLGVGQDLFLKDGVKVAPYVGFYAGNHVPQIGAFSYVFSALDRDCVIGAYSSISWNVTVMGINHPLNFFSTSAALYEGYGMFNAAYHDAGKQPAYRHNPQKPMPVIGNDVWIGQDVMLARGIEIGDGAVVAAGSVVTKSVEPYQIVGGNPARGIRFRFTEAERQLLQWSRWWEYTMPDLMAGPIDSIDAFVDDLVDGVTNERIRRIVTIDDPLTEIILSGQIKLYAPEDKPLIMPAPQDFFLHKKPIVAQAEVKEPGRAARARGRLLGHLFG